MKVADIMQTLTTKPSYLRQGTERLALRFNCSPKTIKRLKAQLKEVKKEYNTRVANKTNLQTEVA